MIIIPTIKELYDSIVNDLEQELGVNIPLFGKSFIRAIAAVQAAKLKLLYLLIGNTLQKQIFPDTADSEFNGGTLERFGRVKLGRDPFPPTSAIYRVTITGSIGAVIPAQTTFKSNDNSLNPQNLYVLDSDYTLVATTDHVNLRALSAGTDSKLNLLDELTATSPIALVDKTAIVNSVVNDPIDAESTEDYRYKILQSFRLESQGGAAADYKIWSYDAQGVKEVYPYAKPASPNEINLYVEANIIDSTDGKGTPTSTILNNVEQVVEQSPDTTIDVLQRGRRPLGVFLIHYLPVVVKNVDIKIIGYLSYTTEVDTLITEALTAKINKIRPFIAGTDVLENRDDVLDVNKVIAEILYAKPGALFTSVEIKINGVVESSYEFDNGEIPYLNSVTFA